MVGLLNQAFLCVKESLIQSKSALKSLTGVTGVEYKLDLLDKIEPEVEKQVQNLGTMKTSAEKSIREIDEEVEKVRQECREECENQISETIREFTTNERAEVERDTTKLVQSGVRMECECNQLKNWELQELKSETDRRKKRLTEEYEKEVKTCEEVIKDYTNVMSKDSVVSDLRKRIDTLTDQYRKDTQEIKNYETETVREIRNKYDSKVRRIHEDTAARINDIRNRSRNKTDDFVRRVKTLRSDFT